MLERSWVSSALGARQKGCGPRSERVRAAVHRLRADAGGCDGSRLSCWSSSLLLEDRNDAGPAGGGFLDFGRKAGDGEAVGGQGLEIVQLLDMAVADVASRLVALPDQRGVMSCGIFLGGVDKGRVPAPAVDARDANALVRADRASPPRPCRNLRGRNRAVRILRRRSY